MSAKKLDKGKSIISDFEYFLPSFMQPRLFLAAPVFKGDETIATLILSLSNKSLDEFMTHNHNWESFGKTGESYVVGDDYLMRSLSRFYLENPEKFLENNKDSYDKETYRKITSLSTTFMTLPVKTEAISMAQKGYDETKITEDYRGKKVLSSYAPLKLEGLDWVLVTKLDVKEAFKPLGIYNRKMLALLIIVALLIILYALLMSSHFLKPINILISGTREVEKDNLDIKLDLVTKDEFRSLTGNFNSMVATIKANREELTKLYEEIKQKQKELTDSIRYSLRIQKSALPDKDELKKYCKDSFVFYKPKDIVSGDFYWFHKEGNKLVIIAADCTGHGVPGSFISLLGIEFLQRTVIHEGITKPSEILSKLRDNLSYFFRKIQKDEIKDGMDIAVCTFDMENNMLEYAGAYNPLYHIRNNEVEIIKADRFPVSAQAIREQSSFTNRVIEVKKDDVFYIFSDGFQDQMGGPRGKKFMSKNFRELLLSIHQKPMAGQYDILNENFEKWKSNTEQTDDALVIGFKLF